MIVKAALLHRIRPEPITKLFFHTGEISLVDAAKATPKEAGAENGIYSSSALTELHWPSGEFIAIQEPTRFLVDPRHGAVDLLENRFQPYPTCSSTRYALCRGDHFTSPYSRAPTRRMVEIDGLSDDAGRWTTLCKEARTRSE